MKKHRVLFCRYSVDGHDRGLLTVMNRCRDAGMEVIYIHFHNVEEIVQTALQEDVSVIGLSSSMGEHFPVINELSALMQKENYDIPVIIGGVIPSVDVQSLKDKGAAEVFGPGSSPDDAVRIIVELSKDKA